MEELCYFCNFNKYLIDYVINLKCEKTNTSVYKYCYICKRCYAKLQKFKHNMTYNKKELNFIKQNIKKRNFNFAC